MLDHFDIAIIGAGIAGASTAYFLDHGLRVVLLETEAMPGYHTTGRSAAFWVPSYGGPKVEPLTRASRAFFDVPPPGFADTALLHPRAALHLAPPEDYLALSRYAASFGAQGPAFEALDTIALRRNYPMLSENWVQAGLLERDCFDIDVAVLHHGFLSGARQAGVELCCNAEVESLTYSRDRWQIGTRAGAISATVVVNAAGAWGDAIAQLAGVQALGLNPMRRTMVVIATDPPPPVDMPVILDAAGSFYFKPDAGKIWASPHDEIPDIARDVVPEEIDVAVAVARFEAATEFSILRVERRWAGLRTFAPDRLPIYGFDKKIPDFFWCVGQGGFGIQTAPAAGELSAQLIQRRFLTSSQIGATFLDASNYAPDRFMLPKAK